MKDKIMIIIILAVLSVVTLNQGIAHHRLVKLEQISVIINASTLDDSSPSLEGTGEGGPATISLPSPPPPFPSTDSKPPSPPLPDELSIESHNATLHYRITCYGPPVFPETNDTANGMTVFSALNVAYGIGLDGICAVSPDTPWGSRIRDKTTLPCPDGDQDCAVLHYEWNLPIIHIDGFGDYLVVDRTAQWVRGVVDIYNPDLSIDNMWNETGVECYELTDY